MVVNSFSAGLVTAGARVIRENGAPIWIISSVYSYYKARCQVLFANTAWSGHSGGSGRRIRPNLLELTCASAPKRSAYRIRRATLKVESLPRVSSVSVYRSHCWYVAEGKLALDIPISIPAAPLLSARFVFFGGAALQRCDKFAARRRL